MFGKNKHASIIVFRDMIQIVREVEPPIAYSFSSTHVNNCELVDQIGFEKALTQIFSQRKFHGTSCTLILDESCLFWKKIARGLEDDSFSSLIPLPPFQLAHKIIQTDLDSYSIGYNSSVLASIQRSLQTTSNKTIAIRVGKLEGKKVDVVGQLNSEILTFTSVKRFSRLFVLLLTFLCLVAIASIATYYLVLRQPQVVNPIVEVTLPSPRPSPTIRYLSPDEIQIEVFNGSGIFGEAGRVKTILEDKDYTISSVGTASEDVEYTQIASKQAVSPSFLESLKKIIESQYNVSATSLLLPESTSSADIIITIGTASARLE